MARRIPPLKALPVFEAVARHLSFTQAAAELHITQAAVSHQIKGLEDWLGVALFRRRNRRVTLTDAGHAYEPRVREALDILARANRKLEDTRRLQRADRQCPAVFPPRPG